MEFAARFENITSEVVRIDVGEHILYGELVRPSAYSGKLPTLICSHGFGASYQYYRAIIAPLMAKSGYAVYCFDFYGGSDASESGGTMRELLISSEIRDLHRVIEAVKRFSFVDLSRLYLWGESQGALVTAHAAKAHTEDIRAMILFYPAFCMPEFVKRQYPNRADIPAYPEIIGSIVSRAYCEELLDMGDPYDGIEAFTKSVLIVHGDADTVVPLAYGERAARTYHNAHLVTLPSENHGFSDDGKRKAAEHVFRFLEEDAARFGKDREKGVLDVYVAPMPDDLTITPVACAARERQIAETGNPALRAARFYDWQVLQYAAKHSFGLESEELTFEKNSAGKWTCDRFFFSLSHTDGAVVVAVSDRAVGVDMEHTARFQERAASTEAYRERLLNIIRTEKETAAGKEDALELWLKKEAIFKCTEKYKSPLQVESTDHEVKVFRFFGFRVAVCGESAEALRIFSYENGKASDWSSGS